jgi:GNAT superfamily N-acetyltransferase
MEVMSMSRPGPKPTVTFRPLTPRLMDDLGTVLRGGWGSGCWCLHPRLSAAESRALPGPGSEVARRRAEMTRIARRRRAPGLLALDGDEPVGWVAVAPRTELGRLDRSRATPRVDDVDVWVIPCVTVRKTHRGQGLACALIRAAADYAFAHGAPAVEAYPRADSGRIDDELAFFGTEAMFRRAGFRVVKKAAKDLPKGWVPRVTMRLMAPG